MKKINQSQFRFFSVFAILLLAFVNTAGQGGLPDVLYKNSVKEQLKYIEEHTRIYENYRAIREDMFQKMVANISDSLSGSKSKIDGLNIIKTSLNQRIDSLNKALADTKTSLDEITISKNSISVVGIEINKSTYNSIMWTIVAALAALLALGFIVFKRNLSVSLNFKKELVELKTEFEAYKKTSREAREKMSMDHFKEITRLKGGG
jgi:hypothetical protein